MTNGFFVYELCKTVSLRMAVKAYLVIFFFSTLNKKAYWWNTVTIFCTSLGTEYRTLGNNSVPSRFEVSSSRAELELKWDCSSELLLHSQLSGTTHSWLYHVWHVVQQIVCSSGTRSYLPLGYKQHFKNLIRVLKFPAHFIDVKSTWAGTIGNLSF